MLEGKECNFESQEIVLRQSNKISRAQIAPTLDLAKLYRYLLKKARDTLLEKEYHLVYQDELREFLKSNDWEKLRESVETISKIDIRWDLLPQKEGEDELIWGASPLLADCEIKEDDNGRVYFQYSFSPKMREELSNPKFYRDFDFELIRDFRNKYALKFYEFCLTYISHGQEDAATDTIPKDTFWELLALKQGEYENYDEFKDQIVKPAVSEVNEITDLKIRLIRKRMKNKGYGFCFQIKRQRMQRRLRFSGEKVVKNEEVT